MATQEFVDQNCPYCGTLLYRMDIKDGSRSEDSARLVGDEHGKYSVCRNLECKRKVRMVQHIPNVWTLAKPDENQN